MTVTTTLDPAHVSAASLPWAQWMDTVWIKLLRCDEATGTYVMLARFGPGTKLPKHRHLGAVHAYTVTGRWRYLEYEWVAEGGDFVHETPGSEHTLVNDFDSDAVIVFTIEGGLVLTGPDGQLFMYEDLHTARERYYLALALQGQDQPVGLLGGVASTAAPTAAPTAGA